MTDRLLNETLDFYKKVDKVYNDRDYRKSYELNAFWARENMENMTRILSDSDNAIEAIHAVHKTWMFSVNITDPVKVKAVDWLLNDQQKRRIDIFGLDDSIAESCFSNPENNVKIKNRLLTPDFLRTVNIALEINKYCKTGKSKIHIVELGAGCGHLARTLRLLNPVSSHVIIDIPESLCFSYMFLRLNFPEAKTLYVTDEKQFERNSIDEFDYIFIPTKFAEVILKNDFDLFVNTASLGEMKNSVIRYWMDFVQKKLHVKYLFTLNRALNTIKTDGTMDWRLDENECSVLYDAGWKILNWELEPSFTRCPYVDTVIARYLEIIAEKQPAAPSEYRKIKALRLVSEVTGQDWIRLENSIESIMTNRDNILVNDMTMEGTLFKLWESIRLYPDENNVSLMLMYLETLNRRHGVEFEETYYYEKLFGKVFVSKKNTELCKIAEVIKAKSLYRKSFYALMPSFFTPVSGLIQLIEEGYRGFNILVYKAKFYAISQTLETVDLTKLKASGLKEYQDSGRCFVEDSLGQLRRVLDYNLPDLIDEDYKEFNLVRYKNKFYGLPRSLCMNLAKFTISELKEYQDSDRCFVEDSLGQLRRVLDYNLPELIDEDYKGFNFVRYKGRFYAVSRLLGDVNLTKIKASVLKQYQVSGRCFIEDSLKQLRSVVDYNLPELVDEGYRGFNIVGHKGKFYAVSQLLGPVDFTSDSMNRKNKDSEWFVGDSCKQMKALVDQFKDNLVKEKLDKAESMVGIFQSKSAALFEELTGLRSELEKAQKQSAARAEELAGLRSELEKAQKQSAARAEELTGLRGELEKTKSWSTASDEELACIRSKLDRISQEYKTVKSILERELKNYQAKYFVLAEDMKAQSGYLQAQQRLLSDIRSGSIFDLTLRKIKRSLAQKR